jgi:hypothetical protein
VKKFAFTSESPDKWREKKMAMGGLIEYLTEKCGGNIYDNGTVEITASGTEKFRALRMLPTSGQRFGVLDERQTGSVNLPKICGA